MHTHQVILTLLLFFDNICISCAQQSAAGQDTLIGIVGRDFVMMGADSSSSGGGGIALTSSNADKIAVIHDGKGILDDHGIGHHGSSRESLEQQAIAVGFAGDAADADRMMGLLKTHSQIREYEAGIGNDVQCVFDGQVESTKSTKTLGAISPAGLDAEAIANLSRNEISSRMRSRQPLQLCLLVGGMVRCSSTGILSEEEVVDRIQKQISVGSASIKSTIDNYPTDENEQASMIMRRSDPSEPLDSDSQKAANPFLAPKLFWLDQYGSLQNMRYAAHGHGSNFAYSILDQRYRNAMSRREAEDLIRECFEQLRQRYVINSPQPPRIKCIDKLGVTEILEDKMKH